MHIFTSGGASGGHGLSAPCSVSPALTGCFGGDIAGSIEIDTEFLVGVRCRKKSVARREPGIEDQ
jgi:hypothetical protein